MSFAEWWCFDRLHERGEVLHKISPKDKRMVLPFKMEEGKGVPGEKRSQKGAYMS